MIARVWAESEASVIKSLLEAYGIPSHYTSELPTRIYPTSAEGLSQIRIFVPAALAADARKLLDGHQQCEATLETAPEPADDDET